MDLGLKNKVALVCGASSGLGYAVAEALAREGCRVAINARTPSDLREAAAKLGRETGAEVLPLPADVSVPSDAEGVVRDTVKKFGRLDIVLANAGGPPPGPFLSHDHATWVRALETNLLSTVSLFRAALPGMIDRKWGRLLVITSLSALEPIPGLILSSASRAGVLGLVKGLSDEVAPHGVTVNALCPGMFGTARLAHLWEARAQASGLGVQAEKEKALKAIPAGRLGDPAELGALAAFLASERGGFVTGQAIRIDGGQGRAI
ncbi:MAG TPA: SDR family oxidoreductase [Gemmatimonadales bacterium]|nr:SDR family oxidoreductase [Gemmatimonadales bacterium]